MESEQIGYYLDQFGLTSKFFETQSHQRFVNWHTAFYRLPALGVQLSMINNLLKKEAFQICWSVRPQRFGFEKSFQ